MNCIIDFVNQGKIGLYRVQALFIRKALLTKVVDRIPGPPNPLGRWTIECLIQLIPLEEDPSTVILLSLRQL